LKTRTKQELEKGKGEFKKSWKRVDNVKRRVQEQLKMGIEE
jgi:hypothetical protein